MKPKFTYNPGYGNREPKGTTSKYVQVIWRSGHSGPLSGTAEKYRWWHIGSQSDIIAYRIIGEK